MSRQTIRAYLWLCPEKRRKKEFGRIKVIKNMERFNVLFNCLFFGEIKSLMNKILCKYITENLPIQDLQKQCWANRS